MSDIISLVFDYVLQRGDPWRREEPISPGWDTERLQGLFTLRGLEDKVFLISLDGHGVTYAMEKSEKRCG